MLNVFSMKTLLFISGFGLVGIWLRWAIDTLLMSASSHFPVATFFINVTGSLLAGFVYFAAMKDGAISPPLLTGLLVGFCGGFTTFSAFCLQAVTLIQAGQGLKAAVYLLVSPLSGVAGVYLGMILARRLGQGI